MDGLTDIIARWPIPLQINAVILIFVIYPLLKQRSFKEIIYKIRKPKKNIEKRIIKKEPNANPYMSCLFVLVALMVCMFIAGPFATFVKNFNPSQ